MKFLILIAIILIANNVFASESLTVCNRDNSAPKIFFSIEANKAVIKSEAADIEPQNFIVTKIIKSIKGDRELTVAIGELSTSFIEYGVTSQEGDDVIIVGSGTSGAKYLVIMGPMGKLFVLGSTAFCK